MVTDAYATAAEVVEVTENVAQQPNILFSFLPLVLIFVVFYFLVIRPQQKKMKTHKDMLSGLKVGDKITSVSGVVGVIKSVPTDSIDFFLVKVAFNTEILVARSFIAGVISDDVSLPGNFVKVLNSESKVGGRSFGNRKRYNSKKGSEDSDIDSIAPESVGASDND